jgi:hypothetical protein
MVFITALLLIDYFAYPYGGALGGKSSNQGRNGLWIRYPWYFGEHSPAEALELANKLEKEQIRYAYFHVRFITKTGELKFRHPEAAKLTDSIHKVAPSVRLLAWVYIDGSVRVSDPKVRSKMVGEANWLIETCGFDGIQWDYEPCPDGDKGFLALLEDTRASWLAPPGARKPSQESKPILSVAAPPWFPWPFSGFGWSESYFAEVGKRCDQIAVMCYDTGFFLPRSYAWLVREQAARIPKAANCEVLLGLATYEDGLRSHNPRAENLKIGLKAARESNGFDGVAIFADYTTDEAEWRWYEQAWLSNR